MKQSATLIAAAIAVVVTLPVGAQMMLHDDGMGGGRRSMINLVSPADSPIQIRRGVLMIGQYMSSMGSTMMRAPVPGGDSTPRVWLMLRLSGVSAGGGLITNANNHLRFDGRLTPGAGNEEPIAIDQQFALREGAAFVKVPINLPVGTGSARILIDRVAVMGADGNAFAVPGVLIASPPPFETPRPTPVTECTRDSDCDDGDPKTRDVCMPMGCRHMPGHMEPGRGPMR
jgi:hypothetical protein